MSIIATGIAVIELDRAPIVPFSFQKRADDIGKYLNEDLLKDAGVDVTELKMALSEFYDVSSDVWSVIRATRNSLYADEINERLLGAAVKIMTKMQWVGGYIEEMYPHQHYLDDSWFLRESICSLEEGNIDRAMMWLSWVYGMYHGRWCSYENYKYMQLDRWNIDNFNQFWGRNRIATVVDIWAEYDSLLQKKAAGITDYSDEIESLSQVYDSVIENLEMSLQKMTQTIKDATVMLYEARALLMK